MHNLMTSTIIISILLTLNACSGVGKIKPSAAIYDFGLLTNTSTPETASLVLVNPITSPDNLSNNRIHYRLNYENPSQVFTYAESRWANSPADLLTQKLQSLVGTPSLLGCHLNLQLLAFDHVFDTLKDSTGIAQLSASIINSKSHTLIATQQFQSQIQAELAEAKGGVKALNQAGSDVLKQAITWSNQVTNSNTSCR